MKIPEINHKHSAGINECSWGERHSIIQSIVYKLRGAITSDNKIVKSNKTPQKKPLSAVLRIQLTKIYQGSKEPVL